MGTRRRWSKVSRACSYNGAFLQPSNLRTHPHKKVKNVVPTCVTYSFKRKPLHVTAKNYQKSLVPRVHYGEILLCFIFCVGMIKDGPLDTAN